MDREKSDRLFILTAVAAFVIKMEQAETMFLNGDVDGATKLVVEVREAMDLINNENGPEILNRVVKATAAVIGVERPMGMGSEPSVN